MSKIEMPEKAIPEEKEYGYDIMYVCRCSGNGHYFFSSPDDRAEHELNAPCEPPVAK